MITYLYLSFFTKSPLMNISLNLSTIEYTRPHITSTSEIMIHHLTSFVILFFFNLYISLSLTHTQFFTVLQLLSTLSTRFIIISQKERKKKISKRTKIIYIRTLRTVLNSNKNSDKKTEMQVALGTCNLSKKANYVLLLLFSLLLPDNFVAFRNFPPSTCASNIARKRVACKNHRFISTKIADEKDKVNFHSCYAR